MSEGVDATTCVQDPLVLGVALPVAFAKYSEDVAALTQPAAAGGIPKELTDGAGLLPLPAEGLVQPHHTITPAFR